ncbi:MAG: hypothetical protein ABI807_09830 [Sporichthyaceae bacterium]
MQNPTTRTAPARRLVPAAAVVLAVALLAACGGSSGYGSAVTTSSPTSAQAAAGGGAVHVARTTAGRVLVDGSGRTLYAFAADTKGHSTCTGSCAQYWPPEAAGAMAGTHPAGVIATLGSITRPDGSAQLTVDGFPAYTYAADTQPGQATGQGTNLSGGLWWVMTASGSWVTGSGSSSGPAPSPTKTPAYNGSGY